MNEQARLRNQESDAGLDVWLAGFVVFGIGLRLARYAVDMPIWGDESAIGLSIIQRSYGALLQPLLYGQVAPIGFLWLERAMYEWFGMSEYAMRLLPALAGIAALPMFAKWVRLMAGPRAALLATAVLAVGNYSVRYAVELKPYGFDLFAALLLLLPATSFLVHDRPRSMIWLIVLTPVALALSFPAVFVAGAIALGLLANARRLRRDGFVLSAVYGLVLGGAFLLISWRVGATQYHAVAEYMTSYWAAAFPPANPLRFVWWSILIHTGNMFEYPFGGRNGGSTGSFLLFVVGLWTWIRLDGRRAFGCLLLAPFALNFVAAALRLYPLGESARVAQSLAPAIILMIGIGGAALVDRLVAPDRRAMAQRVVLSLLTIFGAGVLVDTIVHPYFRPEYVEVRRTVRQFFAQAGAGATVAVVQGQAETERTVLWYLLEHDTQIVWNAERHSDWHTKPDVWVLAMQPGRLSKETLERQMGRTPTAHVVRYVPLDYVPPPGIYWEWFAFAGRGPADVRRAW